MITNCRKISRQQSTYPGTFELIRPFLQGRRILDLGCNNGCHSGNGCPGSLGLDYDEELLKQAQIKKVDKVFFARTNLNAPFFPIINNAFEVVVASHILEHIHTPLRFLSECNRVLQASGYLILGLPVEDGFYARLFTNYFEHDGHIYSFSRNNIMKLLRLSRFGGICFIYHLPRIGYRMWFNNCINKWINAWLPGSILYQMSSAYWVISKKQEEYKIVINKTMNVFS